MPLLPVNWIQAEGVCRTGKKVTIVLNFNTLVHSAYREPHNFKNFIVSRKCVYVLRTIISIKQRIFP